MMKFDKRWLLFLVMILLMAAGFPYLSLNYEARTASVEQSSDVKSMSIALVNEDEGATFNGELLTFGEAFVRSLDNNDEHDWFVVSRGVAESGLNRNTYDMMIIIPNDFSEKALSIDSDSPEQVELHYRINASDDEYVKAEAERTASKILNEFNRRIIDVYFTSIIGNLQDAQDHVREIVDKQRQYTLTYNHDINQRLSGYTDQFGLIKNNTQLSRDSFSGLQSLLEDFENRLLEDVDQTSGYLSELENFSNVKQANHSELLDFNQSLLQFNTLLRNENAESNLEQLKQANGLINYQLQQFADGEEGKNIVTEVAALRNYLNDAVSRVDMANLLLKNRLDNLYEEVDEKVSDILAELINSSQEQEEFIKNLFMTQDEKIRETIREQISQLPSLYDDEFENIGLPDQTVKEIKNVIAVAKGYNDDPEFEHVAIRIDHNEILPHYMERLINHLSTKGVTITDSVWIPENKEEGQEFTLDVPEEYELTKLELKLPGEEKGDYTDDFKRKNKLYLGSNEEGEFELTVSLKLTDKDSQIDVFQPVEIGWELKHKYVKKEEIDKPSAKKPDSNDSEIPTPDEDTEQSKEDEEVSDDGLDGNIGDSSGDDEVVEEDSNDPDQDEDINDDNVDDSDDDHDYGSGDEPIRKIKKLKIFNNRISHRITEPIVDHATLSLINVVTNTISPYQKLYATFGHYFGINIMSYDTEYLKNEIEEKGLKNFVLENGGNSLYKSFNHTDIKEIFTEEKVNQVIESIYREIEEPLSDFQQKVVEFRTNVKDVSDEQFEKITEEIVTMRNQAQNLNDNLGELLEEVMNWRKQSLALVEAHEGIEATNDEEQVAVMLLVNDFQPLLASSQALAEQAQANINSADGVYETLDTIDSQVDEIEQSGVNLVLQADELASNMTEKMIEDEEFTDNFTGVLANSRIGERQNENLYNFLSNPVKTIHEGTLTSSSDDFIPYFIVLTMFIVVLFTAYVISTIHQKRREVDQFEQEKSLMYTNMPITIITAGIGLLEGIIIGVISSVMLDMSDGAMVLWIILITTVLTGMLLVATYLLRQLKMIGMFILLIILSMYLFSVNTLGTTGEGLSFLRDFSPLHYSESLLTKAVQGNANYFSAMFIITMLLLIGSVANLLVINREKKGDLDDEGSKEAS